MVGSGSHNSGIMLPDNKEMFAEDNSPTLKIKFNKIRSIDRPQELLYQIEEESKGENNFTDQNKMVPQS